MPTILRAKCIIVGDSTVGKSALAQVFHSDMAHFPKTYTMSTVVPREMEWGLPSLTTGLEMLTKPVIIPEVHDTVEMFLYDSAGKELFSDIIRKYWQHPSMVMVVYDCTNETSFNSCAKWLERVRAQKPDIPFPGVLVANKTDLDQRRVISPKQGKEFAQDNGLEYFECSAKEMENVERPFHYLANEYYKLYRERIETLKTLG